MTHGARDWSLYRRESATYTLEDLAELAARLGSIVRYDRRGDVIAMETWKHGSSTWDLSGSGTGHSEGLDTTRYLSDSVSLKLVSGSDTSRYALAIARRTYPGLLRLGIETAFTTDSHIDYFRLRIRLYDGTILHQPAVRVYPDANEIGYEDTALAYQKIDDIPATYRNVNCFHTLKMVFDLGTGEYARALYNNLEWDLTGYTFKTSASSTGAHIQIHLYVYSPDGENTTSRVDNIILTQDEP